ncbi:MAG: LysR family transcriptional regulator [Rubrivivax sp.]|nr:LysR family transcriptional regulator [Rubrivivax sp.]
MNLSTRQLRAFLALAELRSFTRAAAANHLSQPAFSALIRGLEDGVGLRLFDRSTRHVELSAEGAAFVDPARRLLAQAEGALAELSDLAALRRGRVALALLPSLAAGWLPGVLAGFRAAHPGVELEVFDQLSEPCIALLRSGRADLALAATREDSEALRAEPFCRDGFHLVCPAGHPLLDGPPPRPRDLAPWPFVHLSRTSSVRQYLDAATLPQRLQTLMEVEQLATVKGMVKAGLGISVVPTLTLFHFDDPALRTRPLRWRGLTRQIWLLRRRDRGLSRAAQALYERLLAERPR